MKDAEAHEALAQGKPAPLRPFGKRLAFASPEFAITILFAMVNSWYFYYLVNIAAIPPALAGIAFAAGRFFDALLDPLVGRWADINCRKYGHKRIIRLALLPAALTFVGAWGAPLAVEGGVMRMFCATFGFALFAFAYTLITVPRMAMLPTYETDYHGRTAQIGTDMALIFPSLMIAVAGIPALVSLLDGAPELSGTTPRAWVLVAAIMAGIACLAYLPFLLFVPDQRATRPLATPHRLLGEVINALRIPGFRLTVLTFFLSVVSLVTIQSMLPFFLETYVNVSKQQQAPVLGTVFTVAILSLPFWVFAGRRLGKIGGLTVGLGVYLLFLLLTATIARGSGMTAWLLIIGAFAGTGIAALSIFPWAMMPDAIDLYRARTGASHAGLCASVFTFSNKLAGTCAVFLNGAILSWSGHIAGQARQSATTTWAIFGATVFVPLFFAGLCLLAARALKKTGTRSGR